MRQIERLSVDIAVNWYRTDLSKLSGINIPRRQIGLGGIRTAPHIVVLGRGDTERLRGDAVHGEDPHQDRSGYPAERSGGRDRHDIDQILYSILHEGRI